MKVELISALKRQGTKILQDLHIPKEPVLITEHGQPLAYLVNVDYFEMVQDQDRTVRRRASVLQALSESRYAVYVISEEACLTDNTFFVLRYMDLNCHKFFPV